MAELLVFGYDKTHQTGVNEAKDRMTWKRGMVVCVQEDGWKWSKTELSPPYVIIKMPGVSRDDFQRELEVELELTATPDGDFLPYRRRRYKIDLSKYTSKLEGQLSNALTSSTARVNALRKIEVDLAGT